MKAFWKKNLVACQTPNNVVLPIHNSEKYQYSDWPKRMPNFSNYNFNIALFIYQYNILSASGNKFIDIQETIACRFTMRLVRDMIMTYSQMHRRDKYSQHNSII